MSPQATTSPELQLVYGQHQVHPSNAIGARFLIASFERNLTTIHREEWLTDSSLEDMPGETLAQFFDLVDTPAQHHRLVEIEDAVVLAGFEHRTFMVWIAAKDQKAVRGILNLLKVDLPEVESHEDEQEVPLRFSWWAGMDSRAMRHMAEVPPWDEIHPNYAGSTQASLGELMSWKTFPTSGGRLILWHGLPGTGKTTALRALAGAWRTWAQFQFVTDPEAFLSNSNYLLNIIGDSPARSPKVDKERDARWQVVVLEDSGEFLAPDAKATTGQALSRLLNVSDGVLGQATRTVILVTTNEPLSSLHPALSRPGRCVSEVEFLPLSGEEAAKWTQSRDMEVPNPGQATIAELYASLDGRHAPAKQPVGFGFAPEIREVGAS